MSNPKHAHCDMLLKVIMCGASGVGKTSLMKRYTEGRFESGFVSTIGVDFAVKTVPVRNKVVKLQIWDTAGQERFRTITKAYFRGCHVVVVVYDVTDRESFQTVPYWISEARRYSNTPRAPIFVVVGAKNDLNSRRTVSPQEGQDLSSRFSCHWLETSAKHYTNVDRCFNEIAEMALSQHSDVKLLLEYDHFCGGVQSLTPCLTLTMEILPLDVRYFDEIAKIALSQQETEELIAAHDGRAEGEEVNSPGANKNTVSLIRGQFDGMCCSV